MEASFCMLDVLQCRWSASPATDSCWAFAVRPSFGDPLFDLNWIESNMGAAHITCFYRYGEGFVANPQLVQAGHAFHTEHFEMLLHCPPGRYVAVTLVCLAMMLAESDEELNCEASRMFGVEARCLLLMRSSSLLRLSQSMQASGAGGRP